jgi:hypothetical protein
MKRSGDVLNYMDHELPPRHSVFLGLIHIVLPSQVDFDVIE